MANRKLPTARELDALRVLWQRGEATVREIYQEVRGDSQELAYTTILSLMQSMEKKGLVGRKQGGRGKTHYYFAKLEAEPTFRGLAGNFLETVFEGAIDQYLVRALESRATSLQELEQMEQMIAEAKRRRDDKTAPETQGGSADDA